MDAITRGHFEQITSSDRAQQGAAFQHLMETAREPVDWAYEVWDELLEMLTHRNNRVRAIAAQLLCGLARSDPDERLVRDLDALLRVTHDERFVTARHCLLSLWKVGAAGTRQKEALLAGFRTRFEDSANEKNGTLIRHDIVEGLRKLYDADPDERVRELALELISTEQDVKYRKKYSRHWRT
jgi:HEAT repeat protein